jgi:SAM domain (Sterile alpha motif)
MQDIAHWLKTLGLPEYARSFAENGIDLGFPNLAVAHVNPASAFHLRPLSDVLQDVGLYCAGGPPQVGQMVQVGHL